MGWEFGAAKVAQKPNAPGAMCGEGVVESLLVVGMRQKQSQNSHWPYYLTLILKV
ncbi:hypothetical protein GCM10022409_02610 [Hymenobacter glaciei]|uniref:Uncharacterized protein n=1 Tax=Hymenobacter glaciei TaxID=877209 RepID=A0ABP7T7X9_9BACT